MRKMTLINPTVEDILLFVSPGPVVGDFCVVNTRGEVFTKSQMDGIGKEK